MDEPPPLRQIADMLGPSRLAPRHRAPTCQAAPAGSKLAIATDRAPKRRWSLALRQRRSIIGALGPVLLGALFVTCAPGGSAVRAEAKASPGEDRDRSSLTPEHLKWMPDSGKECFSSGPYKGFCQGPRRVPSPHGPAAKRAEELGLGTAKAAHTLLHKQVPRTWRRAAPAVRGRRIRWPIAEGRLVRGTGLVRRGRSRHKPHNGFDIAAAPGTPIRAVQSGIVGYSDNGVRGFGNLLLIVHRDGSIALYAHCEATLVFPGQQVTRGQVVALLGATGIARGPHLHFEYRKNGRPLNPQRYFASMPKQARLKLREERKQLAARRARRQSKGRAKR